MFNKLFLAFCLCLFLFLFSSYSFAADSTSFNPTAKAVSPKSSAAQVTCGWSGWKQNSVSSCSGSWMVKRCEVILNHYCSGGKIIQIADTYTCYCNYEYNGR